MAVQKNIRKVAFDILYKVETDKAYTNLILNHEIKNNALSRLDSSFVSAVVYGVLERKLTLDYIIKQYSKFPVDKSDIKTLILLRTGIFQLLFMDKVPDSAAVNETVNLSKKLGVYKSAGFINGLLRNFIRSDKNYKLPDKKNISHYLSVKYSVSEDIINLWLKSYGNKNTIEMLERLQGRPPLTVRINTLKSDKQSVQSQLRGEGIKTEEIPFLKDALNLVNTGSIESLSSYKEGNIYVQDASSQLCVELLNPLPDSVLIDVCAAPGGKSFTASQIMQNKGTVYSFDIYEHKVKLIEKTARHLSASVIKASVRDAADAAPLNIYADRIICDVPCSGFGVMRRKPEIRYKEVISGQRAADDNHVSFGGGILDLAETQYRILCNSSKSLKSSGVLFYSTCTLNPYENGMNAERFLRENSDFIPLEINLPEGIERKIDEPVNHLTLFPQTADTDGFFIAAFTKERR